MRFTTAAEQGEHRLNMKLCTDGFGDMRRRGHRKWSVHLIATSLESTGGKGMLVYGILFVQQRQRR